MINCKFIQPSGLFLLILTLFTAVIGQEITDQKEAERIYRQSITDGKNSKAYFLAFDKCRNYIKQRRYKLAELSCKRAIFTSEKLLVESRWKDI
jgi:hypothetical protein